MNAENPTQRGDGRILDLWIDMPTSNPNHNQGYITQNFDKLDKDFLAMNKATKAQGLLIQSMAIMDQSQQQRMNDRLKTKTGFGMQHTDVN